MNTVQIAKHCKGIRVSRMKLIELIDGVCRRFGIDGATISVGIVDDSEITKLNREFLDHKGTTDCLSFDLSEGQAKQGSAVFDLIVNGEMAARQAAERGHSSGAELALYVTHALLHQLGFDDADAASADKMHRTEDEILQYFGYGPVYNARTRLTETGDQSQY
jgi:probable rRNA maturation factor